MENENHQLVPLFLLKMAEIVIPPLLEVLLEKLSNPLIEKFVDKWEQKDRIKQLQKVLPMVQAVLEDADGRQVTDKAVRIWLSELKNAAYDAEDLLEELIYSHSRPIPWFEFKSFRSKTRSLLVTLQKAATKGLKLNLKRRTEKDMHLDKQETGSFVVGSEVYGREEDKRQIIEKLLPSSSSSSSEALVGGYVPVIPIVGIPGMGKTTLAQLVYNDEKVKKHFDLRIWVFVSHEFSVKKIIKAAIESATKEKCELSDLDALQSKLWDTLCKRRYLLVLDDVWNEDENDWDKLSPLFAAGVYGSKILVTTRSQKVTLMVDTQNLAHQLKGLPENSCWDLFKRVAFLQGEEEKNQNLIVMGKEIVRKCGGVPLAIRTLGSLMRLKKEESEWLYIQDSDLWNLDAYQSRILPALLLSYQHLPSHLKRCFAFCLTFPRNYEIKKEEIIHMWMAHGLVLSDRGNKLLEDLGDEYFNELLWLSFFEDVKECGNGSASVYKINELFYSLAQSAMKNESVIIENALREEDYTKIRHASCVLNYISPVIPQALCAAGHLRTLLLFSEGGMEEVPRYIFVVLSNLRVLKLSRCQCLLPNFINKLHFLRYLDLSYSHIAALPETISLISSLVSLNLFGCYNLKFLPDMGKLTGLRHLNISGCEALTAMPKNIGKLVHLQTLPIFVVPPKSKWSCGQTTNDDDGGISNLAILGLRGELKIKHLEYISCAMEAMTANLISKKHIESLGLCWGHDGVDRIMNPTLESSTVRFQERKHQISGPSQEPEGADAPSDPSLDTEADAPSDPSLATEVLQCLQPHCNLKNLFVVGYPGFKFPHWLLPNLTMVVLIKCRRCLQLPTLGHLSSLRTLRMEEIDLVEYIGQEFYGEEATESFPSLQELFMQDFPLLREWSSLSGKGLFPKLSKLTLRKCPNLMLMPSFISMHHLQLQGCNPRILRCMEKLTSLSSLVIRGFDDLLELPTEFFRNNNLLEHLVISSCPKLQSLASELAGLASLKSLTIQWCGELHVLPNGFQNLTALESLEISDCHSLVALPENAIGGLRSLRTLSLENCSQLASISLGLQYLTALEDLTIMYCPSLAALPDAIKHLSALRSLSLLSCPLIEFLPEGFKDITTLQCLEICSCPHFATLPEWIGSFSSLRSLAISDCPNLKCLPITFQHLTLLQHLSIQDCPDLQKRCQRDMGTDWWKIAHVPYRHIFSSQLQQSTGVASSSN